MVVLQSDQYEPLDELAWVKRIQALGYEVEYSFNTEEVIPFNPKTTF